MPISELTYPRFKYARTGLRTVVCELQFNPILRIGQEVPAQFQDRVRSDFPGFGREERTGFILGVGGQLQSMPPQPSVLRFTSDDGKWVAGLALNSLSLEASDYSAFPDFERRFGILEDAFQAVYGVNHYTRVGLRYVNVFTEAEFPGGWQDKFNTHLLGPLADPIVGGSVERSAGAFLVSEGEWSINVNHVREADRYILDIDHFWEGKIQADLVRSRLEEFNRRIYQVFRWSITESLHQLMEPGPHD